MTDDNIKRVQADCRPVVLSDAEKENPASTVASSSENALDEGGDKKAAASTNSHCPEDLDVDWVAKGALRSDSIPVGKVDDFIEGNFVTHDHKPDQVGKLRHARPQAIGPGRMLSSRTTK